MSKKQSQVGEIWKMGYRDWDNQFRMRYKKICIVGIMYYAADRTAHIRYCSPRSFNRFRNYGKKIAYPEKDGYPNVAPIKGVHNIGRRWLMTEGQYLGKYDLLYHK